MARVVNIPRNIWFQGIDIGLEFAVDDGSGTPVNMTGFTLKWYLWPSRADNTGTPLLTILDAGITKFNVDGTNDGARVVLADTDTVSAGGVELVPEGLYYHELWRTDEGNERLLAFGDAPLEPSPRRQT